MAETPFVSAVIISYNAGHLVERAIASIQRQTFQDLEIIVIDDGSTDDTPARLAGRADLRYIRTPNNGVGGARNNGITQARGEWVAFLDADDEWMAGKLEKQVLVARDPRFRQASIIASDYNEVCDGQIVRERALRHGFPIFTDLGFDLNDIFTRRERVGDRDGDRDRDRDGDSDGDSDNTGFDVYTGRDFRKVFHGNFILPTSVMLRRADCERFGVFKTAYRRCGEDTDLFLRWAWHADIALIDEPLIAYTVGRPDQQTQRTNLQRMIVTDIKLRKAFLREHPEFKVQNRELVDSIFSRIYARLGRLQLYEGNIPRARLSLRLARRYHPLAGHDKVMRWATLMPPALLTSLIRRREAGKQRRARAATL